MKEEFPNMQSFVPPKSGTEIPYKCTKCGEIFNQKKGFLYTNPKCPKCGCKKCIELFCW